MTNSETIEKLNDALSQLIDAYEILQDKNDNLVNDITNKNDIINNLENKLDEVNGTTEVQSNKMDGMLNRIQTLLSPSKDQNIIDDEIITNSEPQNDLFDDSDDEEINLKIEEDDSSNNKIDLGRMESLLNGLNTK